MNTYEEKLAARKARLEAAAEKARQEASNLWEQSRKMNDAIPFGQPILVGHHSEQRDRNYRQRIWNKSQKAYEAGQKAEYYEEKAAGVGNGGISSDDPQAIDKLQEKLTKLEQTQEKMKAANAAIRKHAKAGPDAQTAALVALGFSETVARQVLLPDFAGRIGFASFELTNNNANIRRIKERIAELEREDARTPAEEVETESGITITEEDNRICVRFPTKPEKWVTQLMKSRGFNFSRSRNNAWVRQLNANGRHAAQDVVRQIEAAATT